MNLNLTGKRALIFASSQGIGKAVAATLKNEGATVCLNGRREESLSKTAAEIGADHLIIGDLTKEGDAARITKEAIEKMGGLDIVVTNTGGPAKNNFLDVSTEQWKTDFQSLWLSVVESLHVAIPEMKKNQYGRVLMVTSIAAKEPLPGLTTSNGLRAGLSGLARSISNEHAADGITINLLLPGYTATDRLKALNLSDERVKEMVPAGRLADPQELASMAAFLASPLGGYITAQSISIDGGVLASH